MHILSAHNRSEFLAIPQLIRFEYAKGRDGHEPTLLIKANTLLVKYIVSGAAMQLRFRSMGDRLLYGLEVIDDGAQGVTIWSILEREEELNAVRGLASGAPVIVFLFNELAVNVAWSEMHPIAYDPALLLLTTTAATGRMDQDAARSTVSTLCDNFDNGTDREAWIVVDLSFQTGWQPVHSHIISFNHAASMIDIFDRNEGQQQEKLALWLTDNLNPFGVHQSPQIPKGNATRELTDIMLNHQYGSILIESKTLSILQRDRLPDRAKLRHDVAAHIKKAFAQLRGGLRKIKAGVPITTVDGNPIMVETCYPSHAIVLIPDLDLIEDDTPYGLEFIRDFVKTTGSFPHLLDISELLRMVQAAEMISERSSQATPMMAFDYYLTERGERAIELQTLRFEMLLRFAEDVA